jgi:hypothetical protein
MTDDPNVKQDLLRTMDRGARAEMVNAEIGEILKLIDAGCWETIKISEGSDREGRENAYHLSRAINELKGEIISRLNAADVARAELKQLEEEDDGGDG